MATVNDCIKFDHRPCAVYYPGELVSGTVNISNYEPNKYKEIILRFLGIAKVSWSEKRDQKTIFYTSEQLYFKTYTNLLHQHTNDIETPGEQKFAFSFLLPPNLPSTYIGGHGEIKYEVKVTGKTSSFIDFCYRVHIQVMANINLNVLPNIRFPAVTQKSEDLYFLFSKRGNVHMNFEIQYQGFVPGQEILLKCQIKNASKVKIIKTKFILRQVITFTAKHVYSKSTSMQNVITFAYGEGVDKHQDKDILKTIIIPGTQSSSLNLCDVINISYLIEAEAVLEGIHFNPVCQIPIIIGTEPLQEYTQMIPGPSFPSHLIDATPLSPVDQTQIAGPSTTFDPQMQHRSDLPTYEDVLRVDFGVNEKAEQFAPSAPNPPEEISSLYPNLSGEFFEGRPFVPSVCDSSAGTCEKDSSSNLVDQFNEKTEKKN